MPDKRSKYFVASRLGLAVAAGVGSRLLEGYLLRLAPSLESWVKNGVGFAFLLFLCIFVAGPILVYYQKRGESGT